MAALSEPVPVSVEASLCGIETGKEESVLISYRKTFIHALKLSDQKLLTSLPVRHGVNITSAAVWNDQRDEYLLVQNNRDVCIWKEGDTQLDKAKKRHLSIDVHKLFSLESYEPVVLNKNGSVAFLAPCLKGENGDPVLSDSERITWCSALKVKKGICVIFTSSSLQAEDDVRVHLHWCYANGKQWKHMAFPMESHGKLLSTACCLGPSREDVRLFTLWNDGSLHETLLTRAQGNEEGPPKVVNGVGNSCSLLGLTESYVAIIGLQKAKQEGIGILDTKFGTIQAWQPFPENVTDNRQAYYQEDHILLHCGKTLFVYQLECQTPTLASMIGQHYGVSADKGGQPVAIKVQVFHRKRKNSTSEHQEEQEQRNAEILKNINNLADPVKTSSHTSFKRDFAQLKSRLQDSESLQYLSELTMVLKRCCTEEKFWPSVELEFLIDEHCLSANNADMLFKAMLKKMDVKLMYKALMSLHSDLPESCLVLALQCFLSASDEALERAAKECSLQLTGADVGMTDEDANKCPFTKFRKGFLDQVLTCPFNDVFLVEAIRKLQFDMVLNILGYLVYVIKCPMLTKKDVDKNNLSSRWSGVLIDAHSTHLILAKDSHKMLCELKEQEDAYVSFLTSANREVLPSIKHLMNKNASKNRAVGLYRIEVLHLH